MANIDSNKAKKKKKAKGGAGMVVSTGANTRGLRVGDTKGGARQRRWMIQYYQKDSQLLIVEIIQERRKTALGHHVTLGRRNVAWRSTWNLGANGGKGLT